MGTYKAHVPKGKVALLVIDPCLRAKSKETMEELARHVSDVVRFYLEARAESKVRLTGGDSVVLIRDYVESLAERGRAVPATAKHALTLAAEA